MALSDILVCLDGSDAGKVRLRLAMHLAREHGAQLAAAFAVTDDDNPLFEPRAPAAGGMFSGGVGTIEHRIAENAPRGVALREEAEQRFHDALRLNHLAGEWNLIEANDSAGLVTLAKSVDLAILGQYSRDSRAAAAIHPEEIALACGRPVLIVPYAGEFASVGDHVLIAWDDTREAIRALNDAMPLIEKASMVTVMTVLGGEREFDRKHAPLQRAVAHLERHGIPARAEETMRGDISVSDLLLSRAADLGADMIVAGAFHHSPLREALIGGVSRDLLRHMTVPVLMSH